MIRQKYTLDGWPSTRDCIAWSEDDTIAVALTDKIEILVNTSRKPLIKKKSSRERQVVEIAVGSFSQEEIPFLEPFPWQYWSISEELSERYVVRIEWSGLGLGIYDRCVLAVLTANDILSIWECQGNPLIKEHWQRILIINNSNTTDAEVADEHIVKRSRQNSEESSARCRRIRSFCWGPTMNNIQGKHSMVSRSQYIAVCNDNGDIHVSKLTSHYNVLHTNPEKWKVEMISTYNIGKSVSNNPISSVLPQINIPININIDEMKWSDWLIDATGNYVSFLAYTVHSVLQINVVRAARTSEDLRLSLDETVAITHTTDLVVNSTMQWIMDNSQNCLLLLFCSPSGFKVLSISIDIGNISANLSHLSMNGWHDQIMTMEAHTTSDASIKVSLAYASENINTNSFSTTIHVKPNSHGSYDLKVLADDSISDRDMSDAKQAFAKEHQIVKDQTKATMHGMVYDTTGSQVARCSSVHPRYGLEYIIAAYQRCYLYILEAEAATTESFEELTRTSRSAECILTLLSGIGDVEVESDSVRLLEQYEKSILAALTKSCTILGPSIGDDANLQNSSQTLAKSLNHVMFGQDSKSQACRAMTLWRLATTTSPIDLNDSLTVISELVTETIRLAQNLKSNTPKSDQILAVYKLIKKKLCDKITLDREEVNLETCDMCSSAIKFESLFWAQCEQGHKFNRCNLTFLAIQGSGITKMCGICGVEVLDENKIKELQFMEGSDDTLNSDNALLKSLFAACRVCIYCGGRYVGM